MERPEDRAEDRSSGRGLKEADAVVETCAIETGAVVNNSDATATPESSDPPSPPRHAPPDPEPEDPQAAAWRALAEGTGQLEDDTSHDDDTGVGGVGGGGQKKTRSISARMASAGKIVSVVKAIAKALYAAGGSLDLTSFTGVPIRWNAPFSLLRQSDVSHSPLKVPNGGGGGPYSSSARWGGAG